LAVKVPAGNMAECVAASETTGTLRGICPDCDRMIYRRVNPQKSAQFAVTSTLRLRRRGHA
jgi:hypothetical protein